MSNKGITIYTKNKKINQEQINYIIKNFYIDTDSFNLSVVDKTNLQAAVGVSESGEKTEMPIIDDVQCTSGKVFKVSTPKLLLNEKYLIDGDYIIFNPGNMRIANRNDITVEKNGIIHIEEYKNRLAWRANNHSYVRLKVGSKKYKTFAAWAAVDKVEYNDWRTIFRNDYLQLGLRKEEIGVWSTRCASNSSGNRVIHDTDWHFYVFTISEGGRIRAYLDGELYIDTSRSCWWTRNVGDILLGRWRGGSQDWIGHIGEVYLFKDEFTPEQIMDIYKNGIYIDKFTSVDSFFIIEDDEDCEDCYSGYGILRWKMHNLKMYVPMNNNTVCYKRNKSCSISSGDLIHDYGMVYLTGGKHAVVVGTAREAYNIMREPHTIIFDFEIEDPKSSGYIFSFGLGSGSNNYPDERARELIRHENGNLIFEISRPDIPKKVLSTPIDNKLHRCIIVHTENKAKVYIDGELKIETSSNLNPGSKDSWNITFGAYYYRDGDSLKDGTNQGEGFKGRVGNLIVLQEALTEEDISELKTPGVSLHQHVKFILNTKDELFGFPLKLDENVTAKDEKTFSLNNGTISIDGINTPIFRNSFTLFTKFSGTGDLLKLTDHNSKSLIVRVEDTTLKIISNANGNVEVDVPVNLGSSNKLAISYCYGNKRLEVFLNDEIVYRKQVDLGLTSIVTTNSLKVGPFNGTISDFVLFDRNIRFEEYTAIKNVYDYVYELKETIKQLSKRQMFFVQEQIPDDAKIVEHEDSKQKYALNNHTITLKVNAPGTYHLEFTLASFASVDTPMDDYAKIITDKGDIIINMRDANVYRNNSIYEAHVTRTNYYHHNLSGQGDSWEYTKEILVRLSYLPATLTEVKVELRCNQRYWDEAMGYQIGSARVMSVQNYIQHRIAPFPKSSSEHQYMIKIGGEVFAIFNSFHFGNKQLVRDPRTIEAIMRSYFILFNRKVDSFKYLAEKMHYDKCDINVEAARTDGQSRYVDRHNYWKVDTYNSNYCKAEGENWDPVTFFAVRDGWLCAWHSECYNCHGSFKDNNNPSHVTELKKIIPAPGHTIFEA